MRDVELGRANRVGPTVGPVHFDSEFDFSFRPETYWPETSTEQTVLAKIPGTVRRKAAEQALAEPGDPRIAPVEFIFAERLDDESPGRWLNPEQCERELGLADESK